jgi:hypothetical protein
MHRPTTLALIAAASSVVTALTVAAMTWRTAAVDPISLWGLIVAIAFGVVSGVAGVGSFVVAILERRARKRQEALAATAKRQVLPAGSPALNQFRQLGSALHLALVADSRRPRLDSSEAMNELYALLEALAEHEPKLAFFVGPPRGEQLPLQKVRIALLQLVDDWGLSYRELEESDESDFKWKNDRFEYIMERFEAVQAELLRLSAPADRQAEPTDPAELVTVPEVLSLEETATAPSEAPEQLAPRADGAMS